MKRNPKSITETPCCSFRLATQKSNHIKISKINHRCRVVIGLAKAKEADACHEFTRCKVASCSARSRQAACLSGAAKICCYPEEPFAPCTLAPDCSAAGLRMLMATGKRRHCCSSLRWAGARTATPPVCGCGLWRRS